MVLNSQVLKNINNNNDSDSSEIKELLEENLKLTKEIHKMSRKMNRFVISQQVFGVIKLVIIITPIILAFIYVPRLIDAFRENPKIIFENTVVESWINGIIEATAEKIDPGQIDLNKIDLKKLPPEVIIELQKQIKK